MQETQRPPVQLQIEPHPLLLVQIEQPDGQPFPSLHDGRLSVALDNSCCVIAGRAGGALLGVADGLPDGAAEGLSDGAGEALPEDPITGGPLWLWSLAAYTPTGTATTTSATALMMAVCTRMRCVAVARACPLPTGLICGRVCWL